MLGAEMVMIAAGRWQGREAGRAKVFIVGIAGGTGLRLARLLNARSDEVRGLCRRPDQVEALGALGIAATLGDIVQIGEQQLADHVLGSDLIVFSAGAGSG